MEVPGAVGRDVSSLATACDPKRRQELERDFITYHEEFRNDVGVAMPREYLVTVGVRA